MTSTSRTRRFLNTSQRRLRSSMLLQAGRAVGDQGIRITIQGFGLLEHVPAQVALEHAPTGGWGRRRSRQRDQGKGIRAKGSGLGAGLWVKCFGDQGLRGDSKIRGLGEEIRDPTSHPRSMRSLVGLASRCSGSAGHPTVGRLIQFRVQGVCSGRSSSGSCCSLLLLNPNPTPLTNPEPYLTASSSGGGVAPLMVSC